MASNSSVGQIRTRFERPFVNLTSHCSRKTASFLGLISFNGLGPLVRLESRLNGYTYAEILDTIVINYAKQEFERGPVYLVADNCPAHKKLIVSAWFENACALHNFQLKRFFIPPYSPDINLIENVWGDMKRELLYMAEETSADGLADQIIQLWRKRTAIPDYTKPLYQSLDGRLDQIIRADGYPTRY